MSEDIRIEPLKAEFIDELIPLWIRFMQYHANLDEFYTMHPEAPDRFRRYISSMLVPDDNVYAYVGIVGDDIAGMTILKREQLPPVFLFDEYCLLEMMGVDEKFRRKGVGELMMEECHRWCREHGLDHIQLQVEFRNRIGLGFWHKMGFQDHSLTVMKDIP